MSAPKSVKVAETSEHYILEFDEPKEDSVKFDVEPDDRTIKMALELTDGRTVGIEGPNGEKVSPDLKILEVRYPKHLYRLNDVFDTAREIEEDISRHSCAPCTILKRTEDTRKTFIVPTPLSKRSLRELFPRTSEDYHS